MIHPSSTQHPPRSRTRLRTWITSAGAALAVAACSSDATGPRLPAEGAPDDLAFYMGGFGATTRTLQMRGDTVVVRRTEWGEMGTVGDSLKVIPSAEAWRAFWAGADEAGVGMWKPRYRDEDIVDGGGYTLRLVVDGRIIESAGSNAYPDRHGREHEGDVTEDFLGFVETIGELIGQPF